MITAGRRPRDRSGRRVGMLAGVPIALLLALWALLVGGVALPGAMAGAATSAPAVPSSSTTDPAWSQLGATASRSWAPAGLTVKFASSGDLTVSSIRNQSAQWSLTPSGLGRQQVEPLQGGADAPGKASRSYDNGLLSAWYAATPKGLDQGFTLNDRPAGTNGAVTIAMESAGGLTPVLTSPTSLSLIGHSGQAELSYSGLKVTDASDRVLPAHLETSGSSIRIAFSDQGATYPVHVDPFIELANLVPPSGASVFGTVIATSTNGTTALVGDPTGGTGSTGAATVYTFANGSWSTGTPLAPPLHDVAFGTSVAMSGDGKTALVGDPSGAEPPYTAPLQNFGTATVYTYNGSSWSAGTTLTTPATAISFGTSVALSNDGSTALVGDPLGAASSTASNVGAATIFTGSGSTWSAAASLTPPNTAREFGTSVALSSNGSTALVGDPTAGAGSHGSVSSYSGTSWGTRSDLQQPLHAGAFGTSVALSGNGSVALVGDPTGGAAKTGAATVESFFGGWGAPVSLALPSTPATFGTSVSLDGAGTTALVGDPDTTGASGSPGTASIYTLNAGTWSGVTPLSTPIGAVNYGTSVALSSDGSSALVGDPTGGTGVGWVTTYTTNGSTWSLGAGAPPPSTANSFGSAVALSASGSTVLEGDPGVNPGAASIYGYNGTSLSAGTALASPASAYSFGTAVAMSANGTTALVGDPSGGAGLTGAATVYTSNGTTWSAGTALTSPADALSFGTSVALSASGTTAIVGDPCGGAGTETTTACGPASGPGEATVFTYANGSWSAGTPLAPPATAGAFGTAVALSGDGTTALVGDPTGGTGKGAVTAYTYANGAWSVGTPLPTPANASAFGTSVALPSTGVAAIVGDPTGGSGHGAVNVFSQDGGSWSAGTALATPAGSVAFGTSVALSSGGINAIAGDPQGNPSTCVAGTGEGTATVYTFAGTSWSSGTQLTTPPNSVAFGTSVALSGNGSTAAVGDPCGATNNLAINAGTAAVFSFQSTLSPTSVTTTSANPSASLAGQSVSYSATVAPESGPGTPTGTVSFTVGPKTVCTAPLNSGSAQCSATDTPVGHGQVDATYSGDSSYAGSVGSAQVVVTYTSSTTANVNPTSTTPGSSVTYSATVASGSGTPTGTVTFASGSTNLCTAGIASGIASCTATNAPTGNDTITATYSGDSIFFPSSGTTTLDVSAPPTVTNVNPNNGPEAGGNTVTVSGTGFVSGSTTVDFGATAGTSVSVNSATSLTVVVPAGTGTASVTVSTTGGGSSTPLAGAYTYNGPPTVTGVNPNNGPRAGGNTVTVNGTGFVSGSTTVDFGATASTSVSVSSATSLAVVVPVGTGTVSVTVSTTSGGSSTPLASAYTYNGSSTPGGTVTLKKTTSLIGNYPEQVSGTGWHADTSVTLNECSTTAYSAATCDAANQKSVTVGTGTLAGIFKGQVINLAVGRIDSNGDTCGVQGSAPCYIVFVGNSGDSTATAALGFTLPHFATKATQKVIGNYPDPILAGGFPIGDTIVAQECDSSVTVPSTDATHCDSATDISRTAGATGGAIFSPGLVLRAGGSDSDTAAGTCPAGGTCEIVVTDTQNPSIDLKLSVGFATPAAFLHKTTAVPANYVDGVKGAYFPIGDTITATECDAAVTPVNVATNCDNVHQISATTAANGKVVFATGLPVVDGASYTDGAGGSVNPGGSAEIVVNDSTHSGFIVAVPIALAG